MHDFLATGLTPEQIRADLLDGSAASYPVRWILDDAALVEASPGVGRHPAGLVGYVIERIQRGEAVPEIMGRSWSEFAARRQRQSNALGLITASGLFQREHYERQAGTTFASTRAAVWHFLEEGERAGLSAHPLFESGWFKRQTPSQSPVLLGHYLRTGQTEGAAGPHFDPRVHRASHPACDDHPGGALGHFWEHATPDTLTPADAGVRPAPLGEVLEAIDRTTREYAEQAALTRAPSRRFARWYVAQGLAPVPTSPDRVGDRIAVLSDVRTWGGVVPSTFAGVASQTHPGWRLYVAVDDGDVPAAVQELADRDPRVRLVPTPADTWAERANAVVAATDEPWCAFWSARESWQPTMLASLLGSVGPDTAALGEVVVDPAPPEAPSSKHVVELPEPEWLGPFSAAPGAVWRRQRNLSGFLLPRATLGAAPFRAEAGAAHEWDFLLRTGLDPVHVPSLVTRWTGQDAIPEQTGVTCTAHHVLRSREALDWDAVRAQVADRVTGLVSVLMPTYFDWHFTLRAVDSVLATAPETEVVVVDNGSSPDVLRVLTAALVNEPRVHLHRLPANTNFATGSNVALARSRGSDVVFLNNDTVVRDGWLAPLLAALEEPGVLGAQPLLLYPDDSVQTAGTVFFGHGSVAGHFLAGFPREDVPAPEALRFSAVTAACVALRASVVVGAEGFAPRFANGMEDVDLCLRLVEETGGHFVTSPASVVVHHESKSPTRFVNSESNRLRFLAEWSDRLPAPDPTPYEAAGFAITGLRPIKGLVHPRRRTATETLLGRRDLVVTSGPAAGLPRLRWALKIAAWGGARGDGWGDVAFASDLAAALRQLGQEVVVDRNQAHIRPKSDYLDDVTLTVRGLVPTFPQPGATNLLWVISHPEDVTDEELAGRFDLRYAASDLWATATTERTGVEVRTLLQATNVDRFSPEGPATPGLDTLFVGRTRNVFRPVVRDALAAGADLALFGDGWTDYLDPSLIRADHLPNDQLPAAYRGARIVLNDHWEDMAALGFYSNRIFDAVAAGARVVTDPVAGLTDLFGPSAQDYHSVEELTELLDPAGDRWADDATLRANAEAVARSHSFGARARTLLADVLDHRGVPHHLRDD